MKTSALPMLEQKPLTVSHSGPCSGRFPPDGRGDRLANLLSETDWVARGEELGLSPQELVVVQHLLTGKKLATISAVMGLGLGTVKTYSQRIYRKLEVSDRCGLAIAVLCTRSRRLQSRCAEPPENLRPNGQGVSTDGMTSDHPTCHFRQNAH